MITLANGDVLDIFSDGGSGATIYGAAVANTTEILDYQSMFLENPAWPSPPHDPALSELTFTAVPEPSTWAMMVLGLAGFGFAGFRTSRKAAAV